VSSLNVFSERESTGNLSGVFAWYLLSFRTVAFDKVLTHFGFAGHVDVTVGTIAVVTDSLQEVGTHRHL